MAKKKIKINDSSKIAIPCTLCNPKKYLKFNFSFITYESSNVKQIDIVKFFARMRWMSSGIYKEMIFAYGKDKSLWFEKIPLNQIDKEIPEKFKEVFPLEIEDSYSVMRVYPKGVPNGSANPRIIGMIKNTIFYVFYLDWDGKLYSH